MSIRFKANICCNHRECPKHVEVNVTFNIFGQYVRLDHRLPKDWTLVGEDTDTDKHYCPKHAPKL